MEEERRTLEGKRRRPRTVEASLVLAPSRGTSALDKDWVWSLAAAQAISVRRSAQVSCRGCEKILRKSRVFSGFDNCCKIGRLFVIGLQFRSVSTRPLGTGLVGSGRVGKQTIFLKKKNLVRAMGVGNKIPIGGLKNMNPWQRG